MSDQKTVPLTFHIFRGEDHLRSETLTQDVIKVSLRR